MDFDEGKLNKSGRKKKGVTGLFGMKFMKDAQEKEKNRLKEEASMLIHEIEDTFLGKEDEQNDGTKAKSKKGKKAFGGDDIKDTEIDTEAFQSIIKDTK